MREMLDLYSERCKVPAKFRHEDLRKFEGRPLLDAYREMLVRRCQQPLFLLRAVRCGSTVSEEAIAAWVAAELVKPVDFARAYAPLFPVFLRVFDGN